ncbi:MAG: hypothetical protein GQ574_03030 [Crocinitomix sp.]|nr:hypothetical protein [Crocinitomix sp.]
MKRLTQLSIGILFTFFVGSCTRKYHCDCLSGGKTTIEAQNRAKAEELCDDREFYFEGGGGSGDCWISN